MRDVRPDFPILQVPENSRPLVYLDSAATAQRPKCVMDAVSRFVFHDNANPNRGVYDLDNRATQAHEDARRRVAAFIGAGEDETVFVQNATEGLNLVAYSWGLGHLKAGDRIVVAVSEHHSNLVPWQRVAKATGSEIVYLEPGEDGLYPDSALERAITDRTRLVCAAQVSNVLGTEFPVRKAAGLAHAAGALMVLDIAQSVPHMSVDVHALDVDFAAFSGHKVYAPMGTGAVYIRRSVMEGMEPFLSGGDMIRSVHVTGTTYASGPRRFEAGTRNVQGEVGLAAAIDYVQGLGMDEIREHDRLLMARLMDGMLSLPEIDIIGTRQPGLRFGVLSFNVRDVHPHDVATLLDLDGIAVRAGHHCAQPLMDHLGIPSCVRASFGVYTSESDVDAFLESLSTVRERMGFHE